jgi:hypothetical protein
VGFWLWALVGGGVCFSAISFLGLITFLPAAIFAFVLHRARAEWEGRPVRLGLIAGAGLPLLAVAVIQWDNWHHRTLGDNTPNPYGWGGLGLFLVVAGVVAYAARQRA